MSLDLQQAATIVAIIGALARQRLNILIFAANHLIVLRAFLNLQERGQPPSLHFLPPALFSSRAIEEGADVMAVPSLLLMLAAVVPWKVPARTEPLTPIPTWVLAILGGYFLFILGSTRTVFQTSYASSDQILYGASAAGGIYVLAWAAVIYELRRRVDAERMSALRAMGVVLLLVGLLDFLKGSTGIASGIIITFALLTFVPALRRESESSAADAPRQRWAAARSVGAALLVSLTLVITVVFIRTSRSQVVNVGLSGAVAMTWDALVSLDSGERGEGLEAAGNGTQGAAHVLMCRALYDNGYDREWRSVWGPVEYTFKPSVLLQPLGLTRSREAAWELADYFIHGGGINVFGEFYWNGGFFCLLVMSTALIGFLLTIDVKQRTSWSWFALACAIGPGLLQGYGYGFAQVFRGIANGAIFFLPFIAYLRHLEWQRSRPVLAVRRPPSGQPASPSA